ncbi:MAG TPA: PstS family phosphate ABC transporter substrate-binding protein [Anaerolineaceae bacterium]|jgi:phosphate transport system substrate-binding protein|nr:PstS family phosphate ABC transporter substrate-binding protein [Anaerolineaceae bacterium]HQF68353.1 PstS family phosphate ABC transporter substrate-binding protein [Anaerolineaceae bacterium]HQK04477.1 PstS family phosphate ABC transporter substrate-binding protein [Anaerolineaceae bacterium]
MKQALCSFVFILFLLTGCAGRSHTRPGTLPQPAAVSIENKGSDTMVNLALAWAERYQQVNPNARISVSGGGSGTGITSLISGTVDIANASRRITEEELAAARQAGYDPHEFTIARDAIAIIVNPRNPVSNLTLQQLSRIYRGEINNWNELGGEDREIVRLSRETNSGSHLFFLESVVRMGEMDNNAIFSASTLLLPSSEGIIAEVRDNPNAIGYDSLGYITSDVKLVGISSLEEPMNFILPSLETVSNQMYLLSRNLYMYTLDEPEGLVKTYLDWIMGPEAQEIAHKLGFMPVLNE